MGRRLVRFLLCLALGSICFERASARQTAQPISVENFDVRLNGPSAGDRYLERIGADQLASFGDARRARRAEGLARLQRDRGAIETSDSPALGIPEVIGSALGAAPLSDSTGDRPSTLRGFLSGYGDAFGLAAADVTTLNVVADYVNPSGNMAWVELEQRIHDLPVFQGNLRGAFTARGELVRTTGVLATDVDTAALSTTPALRSEQALLLATGHAGWDANTARHTRAWLVYFPLAPGTIRLAWATEILGDSTGYLSVVDAQDGTLLFRKNLTELQSQPATYAIYSTDSPAPWSPTAATPGSGAQAQAVGRARITVIGNEWPNDFNLQGWIPDNTNATDGSNVQAGIDVALPDGIDGYAVGSNRVFDFPYTPGSDTPTSSDYRNGEVTNIFYWANVHHDRLYRLGFTEATRNFQKNNFGRGGVGGDPVIAQAQDFGTTNNASFLTPADGSPGWLQLSVFYGPNPDRPSGLDQDVVLHELTHGTSSRLHGNATGLTSNMARGMGEGWSDFYARALLGTSNEDINGVYAIGSWIGYQRGGNFTDNYYYGLRRFPYAIKTTVGPNGRPHNPLTLADADLSQFDISDGAFAPSPVVGGNVDEVHNLGEIWAMALLEVRARFIARLGFDQGNERILQFVTDGMKLDPLNPTMLQGRDAILAAASAGGGTAADIADIWAGFAARGMGVSAQILQAGTPTGAAGSIGANDTRVFEAFDEPGIAAASATLVGDGNANGRIDPGESVAVSFCVANNLDASSGPVTASLLSGAGVASPSPAQSVGAIGGHATSCRTFTFIADSACGSTINARLQAVQQGGVTRTLTYALPVGSLVASFAQTFDGVGAPTLPAGWSTSTLSGSGNSWATTSSGSDGGPNHAFARTLSSASDSVLVSPWFTVPVGTNLLSFRHRYVTEWRFDGGLIEIAVNGGAFQDLVSAGGRFVRGGYGGQLQSGPLLGARVWSGYSPAYMTTIAELPASASGQSVRLRWRLVSNDSGGGEGWDIDSVVVGQIGCTAPTTPPPTNPPTNPPTVPPPGDPPPVVPGPPPPPDPMGVQPPTSLYTASIAGHVVTLRWTPPALGPRPTDYVLEGGFAASQMVASVPLGSAAPEVTLAAPSGAIFLRVRSRTAASTSATSNEVQVLVETPTPPSAPTGLLGLVNGSAITLSWQNTFAGAAPTALLLDVGGTLSGTVPLPVIDSFSFPGVPQGTYTFSLRAVNAAGISASSNAVTLTFPDPCSGAPQAPSNYLFTKSGNTLILRWDPPLAGPAAEGYVLNVSGTFAGSVPVGTIRTLSVPVGPGTYNVSVHAMNACGPSPATAPQSVVVQ